MCRSVERSPACGRKQRACRCIHTGGWEGHTQTRSVHRPSSFHTLPDTFVAMKTLPQRRFRSFRCIEHHDICQLNLTVWQPSTHVLTTNPFFRVHAVDLQAEKAGKKGRKRLKNKSECLQEVWGTTRGAARIRYSLQTGRDSVSGAL